MDEREDFESLKSRCRVSCWVGREPVHLIRKRKGETRAFVEEFLSSHPGSTGREIIAAGKSGEFTRSSIHRALDAMIQDRLAHRKDARYWLGLDPDVAIVDETARLVAVLSSSRYGQDAKIESARQLARESLGRDLTSRAALDLIRLVPTQPIEVRTSLLPYVQDAVRAAVGAGSVEVDPAVGHRGAIARDFRYARALWEATKGAIEVFLLDSGEPGTIAWNTVYEVVDPPGWIGDAERLDLARRAIDVESTAPLTNPSAARAVLRRIAKDERLRDRLRDDVLLKLATATDKVDKERLARLLEDLDVAPFATAKESMRDSTKTPP